MFHKPGLVIVMISSYGWGIARKESIIFSRLEKIRLANTPKIWSSSAKDPMELIWNYRERKVLLRWYTPLQTVDWCEDEVREWRLYLVKGDLCGEMSTCWRQLPPLALFLASLTNSSGCERPIQLGAEKIHYQGIKHARWEQFGVRVCVSTHHVCPNQYSEALTELYCRRQIYLVISKPALKSCPRPL